MALVILDTVLFVIKIVGGILLGLFLPGFMITRLQKIKDWNEIIPLSIAYSIAITAGCALVLSVTKNFTGGISPVNMWVVVGSITIILGILNIKILKYY